MSDTDERAGVQGQMLPGIAAICLYMILMTMVNVYAALHGAFGAGASKTGILTLCTLFSKIHQAFLLVRGLFVLAFFLYLVRQETRERLH
jgi:hypothetical protein